MPDIFVAHEAEEKSSESPESNQAPPSIHKLPGHSHSPLSSFCYYPDKIRFAEKDENEKVVLLLRRHPITNLPWMAVFLLMLIFPALAVFLPVFTELPSGFQIVGLALWYLITVAFGFEKFLNWFFNVNIITDERVFDVDFVNLVYREISEANISQIQDVTVRVGSVIRTFFDYGDLHIQTAAEIPEIEFEAVPSPDKIAKILRDLRVEEEKERLEGRVS